MTNKYLIAILVGAVVGTFWGLLDLKPRGLNIVYSAASTFVILYAIFTLLDN